MASISTNVNCVAETFDCISTRTLFGCKILNDPKSVVHHLMNAAVVMLKLYNFVILFS